MRLHYKKGMHNRPNVDSLIKSGALVDESGWYIAAVERDCPNPDESAERIVSCVNALAGVPDPAAFVNEAMGLLDAARHELALWLDYRQDDQDTARTVDDITEFLATVNR